MAFPNDCGNFFDCSDNKNLTLEQALKFLFKADANGCPALNITGNVDTTGATELVADTPKFIEDSTSTGQQNTPTGVVSFSLLFDGTGGKIEGVTVPDKYQVNYGNGFNKITASIKYERPPAGRVIITSLS